MNEATEPTDEALTAHAAWVARGREGDGRLVAKGLLITRDLEGVDLRHADLEGCRFVNGSLVGARLDGARLRRCSLERADLRHASLVDARFEDCDFRRSQVAGARIERTGFLRCAFGDFASQPIGKPDVRAAYAVVGPDLSAHGDGSRVGTAADIDVRWYTPPNDGRRRRYVFSDANGDRLAVQVLHLHVRFTRESGPRFRDLAVVMGFRQFLAEGAPSPWADAIPEPDRMALRETVDALASAWVVPDATAP